MVICRILIALTLFFASSGAVFAQTVNPGDLKLELSFEELATDPFIGEMVLLTVTGEYKIKIAREELRQSELDGFDWMQLGEDVWTEDTTKGRKIVKFERTIALFPNREGPLEISPFVHWLELWTPDGRRYEYEVRAEPISLTAQPQPETDKWWMPARQITVTDDWSNPPHQLGEGEGALRVVTVTVKGIRPQQVPQMPELGSAGAFVFAHPEMRMTRLYKHGPVTRVFWRWTVRPEQPPSAYLKPISIPYFDTKTRQHKEITVAAQRIAMTEEAVAAFLAKADDESVEAMWQVRDTSTPVYLRYAGIATPTALAVGLLGGLLLLLPQSRLGGWRGVQPVIRKLRPDPDIRALKRAAKSGNVADARAAADRLNRCSSTEGRRRALARLDGQLFGPAPKSPSLKEFAREFLRAR